MSQDGVTNIRNVALVGHEHTGKTSLIEAFLEHAGAIPKIGHIKDKNTVSDFDPDEKEHGKSHFLSTISFDYDGKHFNMLDVPGSPDSIGEVYTALRAVECALVCVDATARAVLVNTRRVWSEASKMGIPRIISINRLDAHNTNFREKYEQVRQSFGKKCIPMYWPDGSGEKFSKVFNTLKIDAGSSDEIKTFNKEIIEAIVEADEAIMGKYLEGVEISDDELHEAFIKAIVAGSVFPVLFTSAEKEIGTKELLETIESIVPPPDFITRKGFKDGKEVTLNGNGFIGLVYRTVTDDFVTRISYIRVLSGKLSANGSFINRRTGNMEKIGSIFKNRGKEHFDIPFAEAGDIIGLSKVSDMRAGDTITDANTDLKLEEIKFPVPMVSLAVKLKSRKDEQKIGNALKEFESEDMTFHSVHDAETGDLVISGMSDNHLKLVLSRLKRKYKVEVETSIPKIPYRETITKSIKGVEYTHKKQSGGAGQFARVFIDLEPLPRGSGYEFIDKIVGGVIDQVFRTSVDKGIQSKMAEGIFAGYPAVDFRVRLVDGKTHPVDSKDIAFQIAGREALKKGFMECSPVLLEPIVMIDVDSPQEYMGDIMGDINSRRGKIVHSGSEVDMAHISALVPLAEIMTYQADLKSLTGGEGNYTIHFDHYDTVPPNIQNEIIKQHSDH
ncbi:MAG: elongation factor G [Nitrospinota bacterium]|nr:elongation factor G [Nitrospinota bacterium]